MLDRTRVIEQDTEAAAPSARPASMDRPLAVGVGAVLAMQRAAGNARTARVLARQGTTPAELRSAGGPPELVALLTSFGATKDPSTRQRMALELITACDKAVGDGLPSQTAAMVRALRRQVKEIGGDEYAAGTGRGVPTFDTTDKAEGWTTADAPGSEKKAGDNRRFSQADARKWRQSEVFRSLAKVRSIEDVDALDLAEIRDVNPQSILPYHILRNVLHESWHVAKEVLLDPKAPNPQNRRALMTKLWEYRQWHHQEILTEVMEELNRREQDAEALKPSKGAGSATLSSDIDVNLKGNRTELAVPLFNERFKRSTRLPGHSFTKEPGVVYDVNVYAIDFMHSFQPNVDAGTGRRTTQKEGAREGRSTGGIGDAAVEAADRRQQLVTSLFKARLFMTEAQWLAYEAASVRGLPGKGREEQSSAFREAEERFRGYLDEMAARMAVKLETVADKAASGVDQLKAAARAKAPGHDHDHAVEAERENVLMVAANRIYEEKLAQIYARRNALKQLIADHRAAPADRRPDVETRIDLALYELRQKVAEAAMYANEASMTDATIHHGVVGIQGGMEIDQQKAEGINAVNEHLADVLKEAGRYGPDLGSGAYKAGKYLMRLGDAAKNLGFGYIWGVQVVYELGRKLSEDIKVRADKGQVDTAGESAEAVRSIAGVTTLDALLELATETASQVVQEYSQERLAHTGHGEADTATAYGHRTVPKKAENRQLLNQDMRHPADRGSKKAVDLQVGPPEDFAFRLTEAELDALKREWAAQKR